MNTTKFMYQRRIVNKMTIKEVSERTGVSLGTVSKYDCGVLKLEKASYERLKQFADLFKCKIEDLIGNLD